MLTSMPAHMLAHMLAYIHMYIFVYLPPCPCGTKPNASRALPSLRSVIINSKGSSDHGSQDLLEHPGSSWKLSGNLRSSCRSVVSSNCESMFYPPRWCPTAHKNHPKGSPLDTIFARFDITNGNVKIMVLLT